MERIRLKNGAEYDVIPGGFQMKNGQEGTGLLRLILAEKEDLSLSRIEADFSAEENVSVIRLTDPNDSVEDVVSGYTILRSVEKCTDYLVGHETRKIESGGYQMEEIRGDVYVVLLSRPDLQTRFERLRETVDIVVLNALEV